MAITQADTGIALSTQNLSKIVSNSLVPPVPLTGVLSVTVLGGQKMWPADAISMVNQIIITGGS